MKQTIALDIDEVLAAFLPAINDWYNEQYQKSYVISDYVSYFFGDVWGMDYDSTIDVVYRFFDSEEFKNVDVIPGSIEAVRWLQNHFNLVVITSRQNVIKEVTKDWLKRKFGANTFESVMFGNIWIPRRTPTDPGADNPLNTPPATGIIVPNKRSKKEMCIEANAKCLVDDQPKYIEDVRDAIDLPILFDFKKTYRWIHETSFEGPIAHDWCEVLHHIRSHFDLDCDLAFTSTIDKIRLATKTSA